MDWSDLKGAVGKVAPLLGVLVGGPAGPAIGGLIAAALGTESTPIAVQAAINADPQAALKLAQAEMDNKAKYQAMVFAHADNDLAAQTAWIQSDVEDRKSAREREVNTHDTATPKILAIVITVGFFGVVGTLLFNGKPTVGGDALLVMLGSLGTAWTAIVNYYYGSSAGSAAKTQLLAKQTPAVEPNVATAP